MKSKILLFLALFLSIIQIFSQPYRQGYIILNDGSRLSVFVEYIDTIEPGDFIRYKATPNSKALKIALSRVKEFASGDKVFFKTYVKVDLTGNKKFSSVKNYNDFFTRDTIFLQVIFDGQKPLYRGFYNNKELFYIQRNGKIELLEAPEIVVNNRAMDLTINQIINSYNYKVKTNTVGKEKIITFETYKYQLSSYLSDWPGIKKKIRNIRYNYYNLKYLFKNYYVFQQIGEYKLNKMSNGQIGVFAGVLTEKIDIKSDVNMFYYLTKPDFPISSSYYAGVFAQNNFKQTGYHFSLNYEVGYYRLYTKNIFVSAVEGNKKLIYGYSSVDMEFLKLRIAGKINLFLSPQTVLSIYGGGSYTIPIKAANNVIEYGFVLSHSYVRNYDGFYSPYQKDYSYIRDEAGAFGGMSIQRGRLGLTAWAEITNGFLSPFHLVHRNYLYGFTLSFTILKD